MKGARLFPQYHEFAVDGPEARKVVSACAERGLPVFLPHRIEDVRQRHWMDPGRMLDLDGAANLIAAVPGATIVIPNARGIAGSPVWRRQEIRDRDWYFDLSLAEVHYSLNRNVNDLGDLANFIAQGGADHLVFGTHAPFSYPSAATVKCAVLPVDEETLEGNLPQAGGTDVELIFLQGAIELGHGRHDHQSGRRVHTRRSRPR